MGRLQLGSFFSHSQKGLRVAGCAFPWGLHSTSGEESKGPTFACTRCLHSALLVGWSSWRELFVGLLFNRGLALAAAEILGTGSAQHWQPAQRTGRGSEIPESFPPSRGSGGCGRGAESCANAPEGLLHHLLGPEGLPTP